MASLKDGKKENERECDGACCTIDGLDDMKLNSIMEDPTPEEYYYLDHSTPYEGTTHGCARFLISVNTLSITMEDCTPTSNKSYKIY